MGMIAYKKLTACCQVAERRRVGITMYKGNRLLELLIGVARIGEVVRDLVNYVDLSISIF